MADGFYRLIRQKDSGLYFQTPASWTPVRSDARQFNSVADIIELQEKLNLSAIEMIFQTPEGEMRIDLG